MSLSRATSIPDPSLPELAHALATSHSEPLYFGLRLSSWVKVAVLSLLVVAVFRFSLMRLYLKTNPFTGEANWGHAVCIPVIGLYYLYLNRDELRRLPIAPLIPGRYSRLQLVTSGALLVVSLIGCLVTAQGSGSGSTLQLAGPLPILWKGLAAWAALSLVLNWGMGTLLFGLAVFGYGIWPGQNDFVKDLGGVVTLFGLVLLLCGWEVMTIAWFPILFLVCGIPWPGLVYSYVASPLQAFAASVAVTVMNLFGVESERSGTKIFIGTGIFGQPMHALNVAEACAGLRSLMTFISVAIAVAFLSTRPFWQKVIVSISAIPIAVFCNVMRVSGTGLLYRYKGPEWAEGFTHQFVGIIMLVPAFFLILGVGWILDQLFIEEADAAAGAGSKKVVRRDLVTPAVASAPVAARPAQVDPSAPRRPIRRMPNGGVA